LNAAQGHTKIKLTVISSTDNEVIRFPYLQEPRPYVLVTARGWFSVVDTETSSQSMAWFSLLAPDPLTRPGHHIS
jgi:hypothetical protein